MTDAFANLGCCLHVWQLVEVVWEDARSLRLFGCATCGAERPESP